MPNGAGIRAMGHPYRRRILRVIERQPMAYSSLIARVEPERTGSGRFNYHLKILKQAGLVQVTGDFYHLTPRGQNAVLLLREAVEKPVRTSRIRTALLGSSVGVGVVSLLILLQVLVAPAFVEGPEATRERGWEDPTLIYRATSGEVGELKVGADALGNAFAIWVHAESYRQTILGSRYVADVGWGVPGPIFEDQRGHDRNPGLVVDPTGSALVVWNRGRGAIPSPPLGPEFPTGLLASIFSPGSGWSEPVQVSERPYTNMASNQDGTVIIAGFGESRRFQIGLGWGTPEATSPFSFDLIAMDSRGSAMALVDWSYPGYGGCSPLEECGIYASRNVVGEGWTTPTRIGAGGVGYVTSSWVGDPKIAMDSTGNALVLWIGNEVTEGDWWLQNKGIYAARFAPGSGWSEPFILVGSADDAQYRPQVIAGHAGHAMAVWRQRGAGEDVEDLFGMRFVPDAGWESPVHIGQRWGSNLSLGDPSLAMDSAGTIFVISNDGQNGIMGIRSEPGEGWGESELIGPNGACDPCTLAVDPTGTATAAWTSAGDAHTIWASRFVKEQPIEESLEETRAELARTQDALNALSQGLANLRGSLEILLGFLVSLIVTTTILFLLHWDTKVRFRSLKRRATRPGPPQEDPEAKDDDR